MSAAADRAAAALAAAQRTIVTHEQLLECGLGRKAIAYRRRAARLHVVFRCVYSYGCGVMPPLALEQAALLACGDGSFLSHSTAAAMWGMLPVCPKEPEVSVVGRNAGPRMGLRVHRIGTVDRRELSRRDGLRVSAPARALLELAGTATSDELEHAFDEAIARHLVRPEDVQDILVCHPGSRGAARLRKLHEAGVTEGFTRSKGERTFRALLRRAGLSQPQSNVLINGYRVDFVWSAERVIVEIDGYRFHRDRGTFESDRARDAALLAAGWHVVRFTWRQVLYQPELVLFRLGQILALSLRARAG